MDIKEIDGATRTIGKSQGYRGLPLRDEIITTNIGGKDREVPAMFSEWTLSEEEVHQLIKGGTIRLCVLGQSHPPVLLNVMTKEGEVL